MAFRKAKAEQAALKIGLYGPSGSGKTFTALLLAEGLAKHEKRRIAYIDTEHGTDFYCKPVAQRSYHPEAFDFDAIYTKSITEVLKELRTLTEAHGIIVEDSVSHLWESSINAYSGPRGKGGQIPLHAWGAIKKPYKDMINFMLNSAKHVIWCGRQGVVFEENDQGEIKAAGYKMKAEPETPYEPHILIRMECVRDGNVITAIVEKDRTGILQGKVIPWPTFDTICKPLLGLLGDSQARLDSDDETTAKDVDNISQDRAKKIQLSASLRRQFEGRLKLAETPDELAEIGKKIKECKASMMPEDLDVLRELCQAAMKPTA